MTITKSIYKQLKIQNQELIIIFHILKSIFKFYNDLKTGGYKFFKNNNKDMKTNLYYNDILI